MTDYNPEVARYHEGLRPGSRLATSSLLARVDDRAGIALGGGELAVRDVRRFNLDHDGSEAVRGETRRRWTENWGEDPAQPAGWDVTEILLESFGATSVERAEEKLRVWFSPYESEAALRHVFGPSGVRLHSLVFVRLGGFSCQRFRPSTLDHHGQRFFALLSRHAGDTGTGLPGYVLTDRETSNWGDPDPYVPAGVVYEGWGVRMLGKRDGELAVPHPISGTDDREGT